MKHKLLAAALLSTVFVFTACSSGGPSGGSSEQSPAPSNTAYHRIDQTQAKEMMDQGGTVIVDVRRADEYDERYIPGAVLVPNESIGGTPPEQLPDLDAVLLVYCRTGVRSKQASDKLVQLGYTNVYDFGGITTWPYETETGGAA